MEGTKFRLAARTEAAGKYNPDAPLEGNEDNMFVDCYLDDSKQGLFMGDEVVDLSEKGCLMVVADGMGGMNAGEVASDIAIKTVERYFASDKLTERVYKDSKSRINYMEEVVLAADAAIKADSQSNPGHEGMGSTIIMAWLCDDEICLTWCGDSRAYLFRPGQGLWQVSKDHSYVQGLVDDGKITEVEAFDHPYGNIITRSLGDPEKKAKPDSRCFKVYQDDIFMLCSDGLSGVLRDRKTFKDGQRLDTENLEDIISENRDSMAECRNRLFEAAQRNDWYDNVTAILCEIVKGKPAPQGGEAKEVKPHVTSSEGFSGGGDAPKPRRIKPIFIIATVFVLGLIGFLSWNLMDSKKESKLYKDCVNKRDTVCCNDYLKQYPNGELAAEVRKLKNELLEEFKKEPEKPSEEPAPSVENETPVAPAVKGNDKPGKDKTQSSPSTRDVPEEDGVDDTFTDDDDVDVGDPEEGVGPALPGDKPSGSTGGGLVEDSKLREGGLIEDEEHTPVPSGNSTMTAEELAYSKCLQNGGSLPNCIDYIKNYKKGNNYNTVLGIFSRLYIAEKTTQLNKCKTQQDIEVVETQHNKLMQEIGFDKKNAINERVNDLIEKRKKEIPQASNGRPQPGVKSALVAKPGTKK